MEMKKIYRVGEDEEKLERIYQEIKKGLSKDSSGVGTCEAMCSKKYIRAS